MNYLKAKKLFLKSQEFIENEQHLDALNILVKLSSIFLLYRNPPFKQDELIQQTEKCCTALKQNDKWHEDLSISYGVVLRSTGLIEQSIQMFDSVLEHKMHKEALIEKAYSLELVGENHQALSLLLNGLKLFPYEKMILNNIATLYEVEQDWNLALNYYNLAIEVDEEGGISYYNKGRVLFILEQYDLALFHFQKALELYEKNDFRIIDVYIFLGDTEFQLKHYQKALSLYQKVVNQFPKRAEGYYSLSEFYFEIGKKKEALKYINKAIRLSFPQSDYYYKKTYYLYNLNQSTKALCTLKEALLHFPNDVNLLDLKGEILVSQGEYLAATIVLKKSLENNLNENIFFMLSECFFYSEQYLDALFWINQYIKIDNQLSEAYLLRAKINAITNYQHLALNDLYQALRLENGNLNLKDSDYYYFENLISTKEYAEFLKEVGQ